MHVFVTVVHVALRMARVFLRSCETLHIGLCYMTCVRYYPDAVGTTTQCRPTDFFLKKYEVQQADEELNVARISMCSTMQ